MAAWQKEGNINANEKIILIFFLKMLIPWSFVAVCGPTNGAFMCGKKDVPAFDKKDWQWRYGSSVKDRGKWQFLLLGEAHIEWWKRTVLQCNLLYWSVWWHWQAEDMSVQIMSAEACKYYITSSCFFWHLLMTYFCGYVSFVIYSFHCKCINVYLRHQNCMKNAPVKHGPISSWGSDLLHT